MQVPRRKCVANSLRATTDGNSSLTLVHSFTSSYKENYTTGHVAMFIYHNFAQKI